MHLTATTPLAFMLCLMILYLGPGKGLVAMFAALPFGSAATVNLSGLGSVFIAETAMIALFLSAMLNRLGGRDILAMLHPRGAGLPLVLLLIFTGIGALFLPRVNAGLTEVFTIVRQADGATIALRPLQHTGTNTGQYFRFLLSGLAFAVTALTMMRFASAQTVRSAVLAASLVHIALSVLDLLAPLTGLNVLNLFRNAYVAILDDQLLLGVRRLIAGFPEPSAFGIFTIGLYGFWLRLWWGGDRTVWVSALLIALIALLIRSTSTAAYVGLALYTALFLLWRLRSIARDSDAIVLYAIVTFCLPLLLGASVLVYQFVPALPKLLDTILIDKMSSSSGNERMSWNLQALQNFVDTYGMGTGIGSGRTSGWIFAVLGSIGAAGMLLYLWFLGTIFGVCIKGKSDQSLESEILSAAQSGCAAIFLLSLTILPQPNLGLTFFMLGGIVAGLHLRHRYLTFEPKAIWGSHGPLFRSARV